MKKKVATAAIAAMTMTFLAGCSSRGTYAKYLTLGEYKGLSVTKVKTEVTDDDVEAEIESALDENAEYTDVDRAAKDGDQVNIDFDGSIDGEAWDSDTDYDLVIGSRFVTEKKPKTLSDDYDGDYAGKDADFKVTVNAVQEINVPELNDNYCKKYTDYDTVDEYRAGVRKELEEYYDETNTETAQNDLLSQILENSKVSGYPQDLYDKCKEEYDANNQILADMFGIDVSDIAGSEDNVKSAVEEMVYTEMLTTAIAEKENITVSDDEYTDYVNSVYEESGYTSAEEYEEDYTKDETVNTILYNKVMDFLMQNATVTEVSEDEYYEEDTEMDEEAYDTEEITENETDAEDLEMTE